LLPLSVALCAPFVLPVLAPNGLYIHPFQTPDVIAVPSVNAVPSALALVETHPVGMIPITISTAISIASHRLPFNFLIFL
jgi:hypothetical protein